MRLRTNKHIKPHPKFRCSYKNKNKNKNVYEEMV